MSSIAFQAVSNTAGTIPPNGNLVFDPPIFSAGNIQYNSTTGVITFEENGRYAVGWWVASQFTSAQQVSFALVSSQGDELICNSPVKTGQVTGEGIIEVTSAPVTLSLVNQGGANVFLSSLVSITAGITVVQAVEIPEDMECFAIGQLSYVLSQMISIYSTTTWTVFPESLVSISGVPYDLYTAPDGTGPGFLRLKDANDNFEAIALSHITAVYPGDATVYDPSISYLSPPSPLPQGCANDLLSAVISYLPIGTNVNIRIGPNTSASGDVYKNEYGVLVLSDASGNTPILIASAKILRIFTAGDPVSSGRLTMKNRFNLGISMSA